MRWPGVGGDPVYGIAKRQLAVRCGVVVRFGAFMTVPFILAAGFSGPFLRWVQRNRKYMKHIEKVMGGFLILLAILIVTGGISYMAQFLLETFPALFIFG